jgi:hypothetical protein
VSAGPTAVRGRRTLSRFGLAKVKALAQLRYNIPPANVVQAARPEALNPRIPVAPSVVRVLSPQDDFKVLEARMLGKLFLKLQVKCNYVDR